MQKKNKEKMRFDFNELINTIKKLRSPEGCEWDKSQSSESLLPYLIEELYELIDSIDKKDIMNTKEELGDLLLHIIFQSEIAEENSYFNFNDVINDINEKLIKRHPHVFDKKQIKNSKNEKKNWETQKHIEKNRTSIIDGVPNILPSIIYAQRIQEKASFAGFDWENTEGVWEKINEEIKELKDAEIRGDQLKIQEEIGDLLFTIINLSRFMGISAENALRNSNKKFFIRFKLLEKQINIMDKTLNQLSKNQIDQVWENIKKKT